MTPAPQTMTWRGGVGDRFVTDALMRSATSLRVDGPIRLRRGVANRRLLGRRVHHGLELAERLAIALSGQIANRLEPIGRLDRLGHDLAHERQRTLVVQRGEPAEREI